MIARTVDWRLVVPPEEAERRIRVAFNNLDLNPQGESGRVEGHSKMKLLKNRWSADAIADITPYGDSGSLVALRIEMPAGTKHYAVASDIAKEIGEDAFDDRGLTAARDRLSRISKVGGWLEFRHVRNYLTPTETVLDIGQGTWGRDTGLVVLTDERLFFFDKTLVGATIEEFPLPAITSLTAQKKITGESLAITVAGNVAVITGMMHGQADALVRSFRNAKTNVPASAALTVTQQMPSEADELAKWAALRDRGVLTEQEFANKKAQILGL